MAEFIVTVAHFVMDEFNTSSASRLRRLRVGGRCGSSGGKDGEWLSQGGKRRRTRG
jgi:hypothetical protein